MKEGNSNGKFGEAAAAQYLRKKGYYIICTNYSSRYGEIDIIARNGAYIVFAEVKLRKSCAYGTGREYVTASKQRKIILAASDYLAKNGSSLQPRFDVIEITAPNGAEGKIQIEHIEDAFE